MKKKQLNNPVIATLYQRVSRLALTLACLFALLHLGFNSSFRSHEILAMQTEQTARSLTQQMAYAATDSLVNKQDATLKLLTNNMVKDSNIVSASVFDQYGALLAQSNNSFLYYDYIDQITAMPGVSTLSSPIIESMFHDNKRIGFVRITYLNKQAMSEGHDYFHQLGRQIGIMLILSCILTWLTARVIKRWQVNRYTRKVSKQD